MGDTTKSQNSMLPQPNVSSKTFDLIELLRASFPKSAHPILRYLFPDRSFA